MNKGTDNNIGDSLIKSVSQSGAGEIARRWSASFHLLLRFTAIYLYAIQILVFRRI